MTKAPQYHNQPFLQFLDQVAAAQQRKKGDNPSATIISTAAAVAPSTFDHDAKSTIPRHAKHVKSRSTKKTSSERGYTFRARKVQYEAQLVADVAKLRKDYAKLDFIKTLWQQKAMLLRNTTNGSLVRLTQEYFRILEHGLASCSAVGPTAHDVVTQTVKYKENFIRHVLDPEVQFGDTGGIDAVIEQWRNTQQRFQVKIGSPVMIHGSEEDPGIELVVKMRVGFTHDTFRLVFPGAVEREDLVCACVGKVFVLKNTHRLRFSSDGRIELYLMDINFVEALGNAIGDLKTVSELLQLSTITPWNTIANVESGLASLDLGQEHQPEEARFSSVDSGTDGKTRQRAPFWVSNLEMPFLLDDVPAAGGKRDSDYMSQLREFGAARHDDTEELLDR
uniref:Uncharacterized protein n=1 Tax=Globisporangium ultimum (strain ATCC 200006 / CBS 805.95 / DAOM BR144) TaxID=431595 RepID=K3X4V0_GLOUD